jgi:hypothetical protein
VGGDRAAESLDGFETVVIDKDGGLHFSKGLAQPGN